MWQLGFGQRLTVLGVRHLQELQHQLADEGVARAVPHLRPMATASPILMGLLHAAGKMGQQTHSYL
jgi:broad specificity phosphatase PhoE